MKRLFFVMGIVAFLLASCSSGDDMPMGVAPEITLDNETGVYTVKTGHELTITPVYEHVDENTVYVWTVDGVKICETPSCVFRRDTEGEYMLQINVRNAFGEAFEEMRVDVVDAEIPTISFPEAEEGFTVQVGTDLVLAPDVVTTSIETTFVWKVDGREVSREKQYTFRPAKSGDYTLRFETANADGTDAVEFRVKACTEEEMPVSWTFDAEEYNLSSGRRILLAPSAVVNGTNARYTWTVNGEEKQSGEKSSYVFAESDKGAYRVEVTLAKGAQRLVQQLTVNVCDVEGTFRREKTAASKAGFDRVYTFLPAPGQFINEGYDCTTPESAVAKAEELLKVGKHVSLGGFGGQIVVGFDHSIANGGSYDFTVGGNSFDGSSEPGIVWVMQDENGDGKPNDTWYELKGSEYGKAECWHDYAVTYFRPKAAKMDVQWVDNRGNRGVIDYMNDFHRQDFYYPAWEAADSYTLRGTRLEPRNHIENGIWVNAAYDWGYADNASMTDMVPQTKGINRFRISDAVTFDGTPARLAYIDFVKVQCGVNAKSGVIGELSTEVTGFSDYGMTE